MSNMNEDTAIHIDIASARDLETIDRWIGSVPFDSVALWIGGRGAIVQLDNYRANISREFGSCFVEADISGLQLGPSLNTAYIQKPAFDAHDPSRDSLASGSIAIEFVLP